MNYCSMFGEKRQSKKYEWCIWFEWVCKAVIHSDKSSLFKAHTRDIMNVWNLFSHQAALFDSLNDLPDSCFNWFRVFVAGATQQHMFPCLFSSSTQSQWTADHFFPDREKKKMNECNDWNLADSARIFTIHKPSSTCLQSLKLKRV